MTVVELATAGRVPVFDLVAWAHSWCDAIADGEFGSVRSIVICIETEEGVMRHVAQSTRTAVDGYRLIGMLTRLASTISDEMPS